MGLDVHGAISGPPDIIEVALRAPYVERLIGTLRHDRLDHVLIFGTRHLRRVLTAYSSYYNESRTHLSLDKDASLRRAVRRRGTIVATPILSGLHYCYADMTFGKDTIVTHQSCPGCIIDKPGYDFREGPAA